MVIKIKTPTTKLNKEAGQSKKKVDFQKEVKFVFYFLETFTCYFDNDATKYTTIRPTLLRVIDLVN